MTALARAVGTAGGEGEAAVTGSDGDTVITFNARDPDHARLGVPFDHLAMVRRQAPVCPSPHGAW